MCRSDTNCKYLRRREKLDKKNYKAKQISVKCLRFDPGKNEAHYFEEFTVPLSFGMSVSNVLDYIYENLDGSLAYYTNCRRGICGRCALKINGRVVLACKELVQNDIIVEPSTNENIIRDLITERT